MVGYDANRKAYRIYIPADKKIIVSANVRFDKNTAPFESTDAKVKGSVIKNVIGSGSSAGLGPTIGFDPRNWWIE